MVYNHLAHLNGYRLYLITIQTIYPPDSPSIFASLHVLSDLRSKSIPQQLSLVYLVAPCFTILFPHRTYSFADVKRDLLNLWYVSFVWIDCVSTAMGCKSTFTYVAIRYLCQTTKLREAGFEPATFGL